MSRRRACRVFGFVIGFAYLGVASFGVGVLFAKPLPASAVVGLVVVVLCSSAIAEQALVATLRR